MKTSGARRGPQKLKCALHNLVLNSPAIGMDFSTSDEKKVNSLETRLTLERFPILYMLQLKP